MKKKQWNKNFSLILFYICLFGIVYYLNIEGALYRRIMASDLGKIGLEANSRIYKSAAYFICKKSLEFMKKLKCKVT